MIFGGTATVDRYRGNPQGAGPRPWLLEDPARRRRRRSMGEYLDLMVESIFINSGRGCINCSGIWAFAAHARNRRCAGETAGADRTAAAERSESRPGRVHGARHGGRGLEAIEARPADAGRHARRRRNTYGPRLVEKERARLPAADDRPLRLRRKRRRQEGIHVPVRRGRRVPAGGDARRDRPDARRHGDHERASFSAGCYDATHIDRLNLGPVPPRSSTGSSRTKAISSISCSARGRSRPHRARLLSVRIARIRVPESLWTREGSLPAPVCEGPRG